MKEPKKVIHAPIRSPLADDPDMVEVLREYVVSLETRVRDLEALLAGGDYPAAQRLAHQTKGAGGMYGYAQLSEAAGFLEDAIRERQPPELLQELYADFRGIVEAIVEGTASVN